MYFLLKIILVTFCLTCIVTHGTASCLCQTTTGPDCINDCAGKAKGNYQSCKGCDVYVNCKGNGYTKDNIPCGEKDGQQKYWNPTEGKCTVTKSALCKLEDVEQPQPVDHQPDGAIYTRWGRMTCPENTTLIYEGIAGGSLYSNNGGGSNYLCLRKDPIFRENRAKGTALTESRRAYVYGAEYENPPIEGLHDHDVPCAVCQATRRSVLMIPARNQCDPGWTTEYTGYLAAEHHGFRRTEYVCMDGEAEPVDHSSTDRNGVLFHPAVARCGTLPCLPYIQDRELLCAVCTR